MKSRDEKMALYELVDCTLVAKREQMQLCVDHIDFQTPVFEKRIHTRAKGAPTPYQETVRLLEAFIKKAQELKEEKKEITFNHYSWKLDKNGKLTKEYWQCKVVAYTDKKSGTNCLEFSEVK